MPPIHWDTIVTGLVSAALLWGIRTLTASIRQYQDASAKWRADVDRLLGEQRETIAFVLSLQCSQTRSDILHKCHRYLDDLGKASDEEKRSLQAENDDYRAICEKNGIENHYIDALVQRVMELPDR